MLDNKAGIFFFIKTNTQIFQIRHHHVYLLDSILKGLHIQIIKHVQICDRFKLSNLFFSFIFHECFWEEAFEIVFTQVQTANIELAKIIL